MKYSAKQTYTQFLYIHIVHIYCADKLTCKVHVGGTRYSAKQTYTDVLNSCRCVVHIYCTDRLTRYMLLGYSISC